MQFKRVKYGYLDKETGKHLCVLVDDHWDDFGFKTLFHLFYFDKDGVRRPLGTSKIMQQGMDSGRVVIKDEFRELGMQYASLGTDQSFYENVVALGPTVVPELLESLRDVAWNADLYAQVCDEDVFTTSLMRGLRRRDIRKFTDIANGRAVLTPYEFEYNFPKSNGPGLQFKVRPHVMPPTNIHTIIGRNGVGKTRLIKSLISLLCDGKNARSTAGRLSFNNPGDDDDDGTFANLINVAFSAFDEIEFPTSGQGTKSGIRVSYIGLRRPAKTLKVQWEDIKGVVEDGSKRKPRTQLKSIPNLTKEFLDSLLICLRSSRRDLWLNTMAILESDPIFGSMRLSELAHCEPDILPKRAQRLFRLASSGHKIVLLSLTRLVELVEERTLVLIDEPEAHLHPPLQSSYIRALSTLLITRNGVAILATHSPVMLQEVPQDCVWLLFREGDETSHERPQIETFAENLGVLTREVFRLEVTQSGYHTLLRRGIQTVDSVEQLFESFREHVGTEGRALARSLWKHKASKDKSN